MSYKLEIDGDIYLIFGENEIMYISKNNITNKISIWNSLSKERQQELCMKYIENIDLGYDENRKVIIENVNFRKSFLEEYSTLFTEGIVDKEVTVSYKDTTKVVSFSSPKTEKDIEDYKLQNYYQVEYFKIKVIREEEVLSI